MCYARFLIGFTWDSKTYDFCVRTLKSVDSRFRQTCHGNELNMFNLNNDDLFIVLPAANSLQQGNNHERALKRVNQTFSVSKISVEPGNLGVKRTVRRSVWPRRLLFTANVLVSAEISGPIRSKTFYSISNLESACQAASGWTLEANSVAAAACLKRGRDQRDQRGSVKNCPILM